jgi:hypothetical protein
MVGTGRVVIEKPGQERKGCEHGLGKQEGNAQKDEGYTRQTVG